jgi:ArsR family transcriptional regulator
MNTRNIAPSCCGSAVSSGLSAESAAALAHTFAALGDPVRLRLLSLIAASASGEVCACELVEPLGKSQPTVSHHLRILREAGLVSVERRGTWMWYRILPQRVTEVREALQ